MAENSQSNFVVELESGDKEEKRRTRRFWTSTSCVSKKIFIIYSQKEFKGLHSSDGHSCEETDNIFIAAVIHFLTWFDKIH